MPEAMLDTPYLTQLHKAEFEFETGNGIGKIERVRFKKSPDAGKEGYRFSWWKNGNIVPRALDGTEDQMLGLLCRAIEEGVFTARFLDGLRAALAQSKP